ncbi:uncharacterized protein LOC121199884 isoform X5 [Scomber scombrus]|uniref:Uncharacterized protein LOC121199884 isoform X5 n=2 Tax=Scomber scombrus TaxID=13677 RepID=A0AAV1N6N1_SCOSC
MMAQTQSATETPELHQSAMEEGSVSDSSNSHVRTLHRFSSGGISFIAAVLIGMVYGAPGGLLLGSLEVATLTCLESSNSLTHLFPQSTLITFAGPFYNYIVILSSAVGIITGVVSYSEVINLAILFRDTWIWYIVCGYVIPFLVGFVLFAFGVLFSDKFVSSQKLFALCKFYGVIILLTVLVHFVLLYISAVHIFISQTVAVMILSFLYFSVENLTDTSLHFKMVPVSIVFLITEILLAVINPMTAFDTAASTVTVAEFITVFTSQLLMVQIGMSLFVSWQRGGAGKICFAAAASGTAVLRLIPAALPMLGAAPSIGALMGVAGAVGVSVAAAGAAVDCYGWGGRLGVAVGAAVGGFATSCTHSGLSGVFIGLCAAIIFFVLTIFKLYYNENNINDQVLFRSVSCWILGKSFYRIYLYFRYE